MAQNIELCDLWPLTPLEDITNFAAHFESFHNTSLKEGGSMGHFRSE
jgi:hypothetical protein